MRCKMLPVLFGDQLIGAKDICLKFDHALGAHARHADSGLADTEMQVARGGIHDRGPIRIGNLRLVASTNDTHNRIPLVNQQRLDNPQFKHSQFSPPRGLQLRTIALRA